LVHQVGFLYWFIILFVLCFIFSSIVVQLLWAAMGCNPTKELHQEIKPALHPVYFHIVDQAPTIEPSLMLTSRVTG